MIKWLSLIAALIVLIGWPIAVTLAHAWTNVNATVGGCLLVAGVSYLTSWHDYYRHKKE